MGKIKQLDESLSNKIAAGELVERPSSVVKELVENAIDANASRIDVSVEEGGLKSIQVLDDGDGIAKDDCEMAFQRHATSKIKENNDLFRIHTLGFRGEALPSIASVSRLTIETGNGVSPSTRLHFQGGHCIARSSAKSRKGTEIVVKDLFYNTPARLKYMKTIHTELGKISDVINRLAMARPDICFQLVHNGRRLLFTNGNGNLRQVIAAIYGRPAAQKMIEIKKQTPDFSLTGYVAKPEINRASRRYMSTFMNGRYVRHFPLYKAIEEAYHTLLPIHRFPIAILQVEMDASLLDVNVHPSKLEVRVSKEEELLSLVESTIKASLKKERLIPEMNRRQSIKNSEQLTLSFENQGSVKEEQSLFRPSSSRSDNREMKTIEPTSTSLKPLIDNHTMTKKDDLSSKVEPDDDEQKQTAKVPDMSPIGQLHGTYILAENEDGLYIIDQHAAQERIFYEYYKKQVANVDHDQQELMIPITIDVSPAERVVIEEHEQKLRQVGLFLESFGPNTFRISSHPTWFPKGEEESLIREMLDQLLSNKNVNLSKLREETAILMSCKQAIKANRHLRPDEIESLIASLKRCTDPYTCPHGRPIIVHVSTYEMKKWFKRIM